MKFSFPFSRCFSFPSKEAENKSRQLGYADMRIFQSFHVYSYNELKAATRDFRSSNKIGEGGFGSVYKGELQDGSLVAVKVLSAESKQGEREFLSELTALSNVTHKNLVKLHGACVDGKTRMLVYEYMEKNSVAQILLGGDYNRLEFCWKSRREISLGVARALAYLHEELTPHVVHRDIKPSNILLDRDFNPKVSDFGLSKLFSENITHVSTRVAGTLGYLAPEYAFSGHLTRKSDVYSYGVLLLAILTGRPIVEFSLECGEYHLVEKVWEMFNANKLLELMDPTLNGKYPEDEAVRLLKVGLLCVQETPGHRPKMSTAVKMMTSGDINMLDVQISRPGFVHDFGNLESRNRPLEPDVQISRPGFIHDFVNLEKGYWNPKVAPSRRPSCPHTLS